MRYQTSITLSHDNNKLRINGDGGGENDAADHINQVAKVCHVVSVTFPKDFNPSLGNFLEVFFFFFSYSYVTLVKHILPLLED